MRPKALGLDVRPKEIVIGDADALLGTSSSATLPGLGYYAHASKSAVIWEIVGRSL